MSGGGAGKAAGRGKMMGVRTQQARDRRRTIDGSGAQTAGMLSIILTAPLGAMLIAATGPKWLEVHGGKSEREGRSGGAAGGGDVGVEEGGACDGCGRCGQAEIDADTLGKVVSVLEVEVEEAVQDIGASRMPWRQPLPRPPLPRLHAPACSTRCCHAPCLRNDALLVCRGS
jgi:hypothetical protein